MSEQVNINSEIETHIRKMLKEGLVLCNDEQQLMFKRMYSHKNLELPINEVVDNMESEKLDWAVTQVQNSISKGKR